MTIKILADDMSTPAELVRPGHIFPLIAKEGGALVRTGHTEGSIDLCKLAGLAPTSVICEVMKDDGTMARRPDLNEFCKKHDINIVYISDIVEYRMQHELLVREIAQSKTSFLGASVKKIDMLDHEDNHHIAYVFGEVKQECAVKFHNIIPDIELFNDTKNFQGMLDAVAYLKENGGILIFLEDENTRQKQMKEYGIGAQILKKFGVNKIHLLTTSKGKEYVSLSGFGLEIVEEI